MTAKGSNTGRWLMGALSTVLVAALILVLVQNYFKVTDCNNREGETKQNLHAIQLAIERYAVDHDGTYPLWLSGGSELRQEIRRMDTSVWVEGGELVDVVDFDPGPPSPDLLADPLMAEGYMPRYPLNPFTRGSSTVHEDQLRDLQEQLDDSLRPDNGSGFAPPALRFGSNYDLMGNVLADPRFSELTVAQDGTGNPVTKRTGSDVIYRCWDTEELDRTQYWLQGQFFYKSDAGHYSESNNVSVLDFTGDVADNYILGCYGSFRNKGKDILGEEHSAPWWVETGRRPQVWGFHGIPVPGSPLRQGSPFGSSNGTPPSPFQYGNPNGVRDGIILVLTRGEGYDSESIEEEKKPVDDSFVPEHGSASRVK